MPLGNNRLFVCLLDVLNILYCQRVSYTLVTQCHVARLRVELRGMCVCGSPVVVVTLALAVANSIKMEIMKIKNANSFFPNSVKI